MAAIRRIADQGLRLTGRLLGGGIAAARSTSGRAVEELITRLPGVGRATARRPPEPAPARPAAPPTRAPGGNGAEAARASLAEPAAWSPDDTAPAPPLAEEHVSEEATLAGEFAEVGAEEGPGPNIEIAEPWDGYDRMRARDIAERLQAARSDVAAAVQLYESSTKRRATVLAAAKRALRG